MSTNTPQTPIPLISVDPNRPADAQPIPLHNRWHPAIPHVATAKTNVPVRLESLDWTGGQIQNNDSAHDIATVDLTRVHHLTGPVRVEDSSAQPAHPGDLLVVDILDIGALHGHEWGFSGIFSRQNGGGFLTDHFPHPAKAIWDFHGRFATSRHIPGVRFPGIIHPGLMGTAPSKELLDIWNRRERQLVEEGASVLTLGSHLHTRPLACLPERKGALLGKVRREDAEFDEIAAEAARTIPGREHGGNCDIKNLTIGCRVYLPVFVEGANLSFGDLHFSQGDGEVSFCGAIEMAGYMVIKMDIIRGGVGKYLKPIGPSALNVFPLFEISPLEPRFTEWLVFEGQSVDEDGKQHFLDASISYKRCVLHAINYLSQFGWSREQIYMLLSCCPCEGRISGIVDVPNCCTTLAVPTSIFDVNVRPCHDGPPAGPRVIRRANCAVEGKSV